MNSHRWLRRGVPLDSRSEPAALVHVPGQASVNALGEGRMTVARNPYVNERTRVRQAGALIAGAALLASLAVASVVAPTAAQVPECDGQRATITDNDRVDRDPRPGYIIGTAGVDVIVGTDGGDFIWGRGGGDAICGGLGDDRISGGAGRDRLFGDVGDDSLQGGQKADLLVGGPGDDNLQGHAGSDVLKGGFGDDRLNGHYGDDILKGGAGRDSLNGRKGDDKLRGNGGPDWIRGGPGDDAISGGAGDDDCVQQGGAGPVRRCEQANLRVTLSCPDEAAAGSIDCRVRVKNQGPDATTYQLMVRSDAEEGTPECTPLHGEGWQPLPALAADAERRSTYTLLCSPDPAGSQYVWAWVDTDAWDRIDDNNQDDELVVLSG